MKTSVKEVTVGSANVRGDFNANKRLEFNDPTLWEIPIFQIEMDLFLRKFTAEIKNCLTDIDPADRVGGLGVLKGFIKKLYNCYFELVDWRDEKICGRD